MPEKKTLPQVIRGDAFTITPSEPFRIDSLPSPELSEIIRRKAIPTPQPGPPPATEVPEDMILPRRDDDRE